MRWRDCNHNKLLRCVGIASTVVGRVHGLRLIGNFGVFSLFEISLNFCLYSVVYFGLKEIF